MSNKDWKGNYNSIYKTIGASNHTDKERQSEDYYATSPEAIDKLLEVEKFHNEIWEPAVGGGHLAKRLTELGYDVFSSDIVDRGYPNTHIIDFLDETYISEHYPRIKRDIITNPPYAKALEFVKRALEVVADGYKVAMFLKLTFLEGKARRKLFEKHPPKKVYVFSERIMCAKNGDFEAMKAGGGSAVAYAWFVFEKNPSGGGTIVEWI